MNMTKSNIKSRLSDWFLIQRIRITNFMKEHKYVSAFIGVFLMSCIVAVIVYAQDDTVGVANITNISVKKINSSEKIEKTKSFSTVVYEVSYDTDASAVRFQISIGDDIDAYWDTSDMTATYEVPENMPNNGKTFNVTVYNTPGININKQLYLNVRNVENGKSFAPSIKALDNKTPVDGVNVNPIIVESEKVDLTAKIISGTSYKSSDYQEGRLAPFGILVGFDKSNLKTENEDSLEGLYFDPNLSLILEATQTVNGVNSQIELKNDNNKFFGLYDKRSNLLPSMPHYINDYQYYSVYNSGKTPNLTKSKSGVSGAVTENKNPDLYLIGAKTMNLELGEKYEEYGVSTTNGGSAICKTSSSSCTRVIKDKDGNEITDNDVTKSVGDYIVSYEYNTASGVTKVNRNIKVAEKTTATLNDDVYELNGNKTITLVKGTAYSESGIRKNGAKYYNYESIIKKDGDAIEKIDTTIVGTYVITYKISDVTSQTPETVEETLAEEPTIKEVTLTRTVKVVEGLEYLKAQTITASTIYAPSDGSFTNPLINLDGKDMECTSDSGCEIKYYDPISKKETTIDKQKAGTYNAIYKITDKNGFELQTGNVVNIQTKYDFNIEEIKSDGTINLYGDDFVALGSYFVNAASPRALEVSGDIAVNLRIGDVVSENVINKAYSTGTKTNRLTFNTDASGMLTELPNDTYLAYGEEVILRSVFNYSSDGDDNIGTLTTRIPIGTAVSSANNPAAPFTMIEYNNSVGNNEPYYVNEELKDKVKVSYYACEMEESKTTCISGTEATYETFDALNDALMKNDKLRLAYLTYVVNDVSPGSEIDFRIRLKTNVGNHAGKLTMTLTSAFDEKQENGTNQSKNISASSVINVTAFKARTKIFIDDNEQDIIINGANVNSSTWTIYPTISLPAELVNTNIATIDELSNITIVVTLPDGINYLYNENYDIPSVSGNGKTLTYVLKGKHVNEWIDPITFEASYDIDIPSGTRKEVNVLIQATSTSGISDVSSENLRTTTRTVTYQNNEVITYAQYTPYTAISKETSFNVSTKLYNNDSKEVTHSNLDIVMLLPYNDVSNEKNKYTGTYTISNLPKGALCTTSIPSLISDSKKLLSDDEITWEDCSKYQSENYVGITAIRVNGISLAARKTYEQSITINPVGNKTDDSYQINSYLIMDSDDKRIVKSIKALNIDVISKRITGTIWEDFDANGIMDAQEKKVSGVTLKLYNAETDELMKTTTSDEKGKYSLSDLIPGTYYVEAEYNTAKYGVSPYQVSLDKSFTSSFKTIYGSGLKNDEIQGYSLGDVNMDNNITIADTKLILSYVTNTVTLTDKQKILADVNQDGKITNVDARYILQIIGGNREEINDEKIEDIELSSLKLRTENIEITDNTKLVSNINLGLALRKEYSVKLKKYVTKAITTNNLGVSTIKDYGNVSLAKLDVKDINNLGIKVVYTIELENVGYYPGYIYNVKDYIPDGMKFNPDYEENKGWVMTEYGYLENNTLFDQLVAGGEKKYLTVAFDIVRKEAGSFVNYAAVDDEDLQILVVAGNEDKEGDSNE